MFNADICGHVAAIDNRYHYIQDLFRDYITDKSAEFVLSASDEAIAAENVNGNNYSSGYLESLAIYRCLCERLVFDDIILFHCSALMCNEKAILFTAPSGTGKSTHSALWRKVYGNSVKMINDDKPLIKFGSGITVYGTPYGGKNNIQNNISAPVKAIIILHQSPNNYITKLDSKNAFPRLLSQTYRCSSIEGAERTLRLVDRLSKLPVYSMGCNISEDAAIMAYNTVFDSLSTT